MLIVILCRVTFLLQEWTSIWWSWFQSSIWSSISHQVWLSTGGNAVLEILRKLNGWHITILVSCNLWDIWMHVLLLHIPMYQICSLACAAQGVMCMVHVAVPDVLALTCSCIALSQWLVYTDGDEIKNVDNKNKCGTNILNGAFFNCGSLHTYW